MKIRVKAAHMAHRIDDKTSTIFPLNLYKGDILDFPDDAVELIEAVEVLPAPELQAKDVLIKTLRSIQRQLTILGLAAKPLIEERSNWTELCNTSTETSALIVELEAKGI